MPWLFKTTSLISQFNGSIVSFRSIENAQKTFGAPLEVEGAACSLVGLKRSARLCTAECQKSIDEERDGESRFCNADFFYTMLAPVVMYVKHRGFSCCAVASQRAYQITVGQ